MKQLNKVNLQTTININRQSQIIAQMLISNNIIIIFIIVFRFQFQNKQSIMEQQQTIKDFNWSKYIESLQCSKLEKKSVRQNIYRFVPIEHKPKFWNKLINLQEYIKQNKKKQKSYEELSKIQSKDRIYIQNDIPRTITAEEFDDAKYKEPLKKLVTAFCNKFPQVGYHSGMTFFMLRLLYVFSDQNTFFMLSYVFQNDSFNLNKKFSKQYQWINQFQLKHDALLKKHCSELINLLQINRIQTRHFFIIWLKTFFLYRFPTTLSFKIWELYLLQGNIIWLYSSVSIIANLFKVYFKPINLTADNQTILLLKIFSNSEEYPINGQIQAMILQNIEELLLSQANIKNS